MCQCANGASMSIVYKSDDNAIANFIGANSF